MGTIVTVGDLRQVWGTVNDSFTSVLAFYDSKKSQSSQVA